MGVGRWTAKPLTPNPLLPTERPADAREHRGDLILGDGADREAHPAGFFLEAKSLERNDRAAGLFEQVAADLLVCVESHAADGLAVEVEAHREIDRPLRRDGLDG